MFFNAHTHFESNEGVNITNVTIKNLNDSNFFSTGVHPWNSEYFDDNFLKITQNSLSEKCLAIGEIGLDKQNGPKLEVQIHVFFEQIKIAESKDLPVIIHCVKAWNELFIIYKQTNPKQTWVFHGFNKVGILESVLKTNMMISIGATIFTNTKLQNSLNLIPNEKLLLETDNVEIDIFEIYKKVSEIKQIPLQRLEKIIEENFKRTFKKWQSGLSEQN